MELLIIIAIYVFIIATFFWTMKGFPFPNPENENNGGEYGFDRVEAIYDSTPQMVNGCVKSDQKL